MADKSTLRASFAALRSRIPPEERQAAEAAMYRRLFSLPAWREASLICGYVSMRGEPDTDPIWRQAAAEGKTYALPVTLSDAREGRMAFRALPGYTPDRLVTARFGIREPEESCHLLEPGELSRGLILVPGLAFDPTGRRIGYGGGYYDRFLEALARSGVPVTTVGLVFSVCLAPALPHEPHDIPVSIIIDERRTTQTHEAK
jgi:5-formyltetrahydrofolate cyclo-ligase